MITIKEKISTYFWWKKVCILWFWIEGKNSLQFLSKFCGLDKENITIHDNRTNLVIPGHTVIWWASYLQGLNTYDIIIRSAGVSPHQKWLEGLEDKITSQTQLFFQFFPNKTLLVTGTKWKSTTVSLISKMFQLASLDYQLIWNIWIPPLQLLTESILPEWAVIEGSSYQLDWVTLTPDIWIITSLYHEHHIDWHWWEAQYFMSKINAIKSAKIRIIAEQIEDDYSILAYDLLHSKFWKTLLFWKRGKYRFSKWSFYVKENVVAIDKKMKLKWKHNRMNASSVLGVCDQLWLDYKYFQEAINSFAWLEHRLEDCWIYWWIRWVNDAISTTPESTIAALHALWNDVETIFLGGKDWWYDFRDLITLMTRSQIKNIALFWDSWKIIKQLLPHNCFNIFETSLMQEAVQFAHKNTNHNKISLLSCASPSYWLRKNFEEKGWLFKQEIKKLPQ